FEVQKLEISASAEVQKAFAEAFGEMMGKANMQIFGDPTTLSNMARTFMTSASYGQMVNGLQSTTSPDVQQMAGRLLGGLGGALAAALQKATGHNIDATVIERV